MLVEEIGYLPRVQKSTFGLTPAAWAKGDAALNAGDLAPKLSGPKVGSGGEMGGRVDVQKPEGDPGGAKVLY
jgi:hypothetical protein